MAAGLLGMLGRAGQSAKGLASKYKDELLIGGAEDVCKKQGIKYIFSIGRNKHLIEIHKNLGYQVDDNPSHEITKKLN